MLKNANNRCFFYILALMNRWKCIQIQFCIFLHHINNPITVCYINNAMFISVPSTQKSVSGSTDDELDEGSFSDPTIASYLDVAVIRALLITHWQEKGVYWALSYIHNRLIEIKAYMIIRKSTRQRSNSLPSGERKLSVAPEQLTNPVWDDLKIENKPEEGRSHLHVAFNDTERRKSSDNCE